MTRKEEIDLLKGIGILAVIFYHLNILKYGYLGVDIFFVISGYLTTMSLDKLFENRRFNYFYFIVSRIKRLLPLVLIASGICLAIGFIGMLPDDFENLSESIVASNLLSENILSVVTTGNYWDISNAYKPLMHMWYVGVLFEFYIIYSIVLWMLNKYSKDVKNIILVALFFISIGIYLLPTGGLKPINFIFCIIDFLNI